MDLLELLVDINQENDNFYVKSLIFQEKYNIH